MESSDYGNRIGENTLDGNRTETNGEVPEGRKSIRMGKGNRQLCLAICNYAVLLFNLVFVCACAATEWEYEIQNKTIWLLLSVLILSGILFARAEGGKWKKRGIEVCTVILAFPVCLFLIFGGVLIGFDDVSEQSFVSPGGRYKAVLTSVDAGTFGGVTEVSVYETDQWISLPFGTLKHLRYRYTRGWVPRDELKLSWEDDHTVRFGDKVFVVDN